METVTVSSMQLRQSLGRFSEIAHLWNEEPCEHERRKDTIADSREQEILSSLEEW